MSAGKYQDSVYVTDAGLVTTVSVQPETVAAWNAVGAGSVGAGLPSARVGGGRNTIGINARLARFRWAGNPPTGYDPNGIITLPIFTKTAFDALVKNVSYPYLSGGLELVGKTGEKVR